MRGGAIGLLTPKCPVDERERDWIGESMAWFRDQFGDGPLSASVILPTREYFPPPYSGSDADVRRVVRAVAGFMGVQVQVEVEFSSDMDRVQTLQRTVPGGLTKSSGAAGVYSERHGGRRVISVDRANVGQPARLIAVIAHELGHVRLLGERRKRADRKDSEPLTDLATVYLGMGIFTANSAFDFSSVTGLGTQGWRAQRLGYMTEQMFGYALACYASARGEPDPHWVKYLDTNPRTYMKQGLRYLRHASREGGIPG
jgi:hypothetical protein